MTADLDEGDYLRRLELLARDPVDHAHAEGRPSHERDPADATDLQRTVREIARTLRHHRFDGDGRLEERPSMGLGGWVGPIIVSPGPWSGLPATHAEVVTALR